MANGLLRALTRASWNIHSATGGNGASGKCLGRKGRRVLYPTPSLEKQSALRQNLSKRLACTFLPNFLFMGEKECSAAMQTGKDCSPEKCDYSLLIIEKASNLSIYKNLKQNTIQILKLDTLSWSLANLSASIWGETQFSAKGFWRDSINKWIWGEKLRLYVPSVTFYWDSPLLTSQCIKQYTLARPPGIKLIRLLV